ARNGIDRVTAGRRVVVVVPNAAKEIVFRLQCGKRRVFELTDAVFAQIVVDDDVSTQRVSDGLCGVQAAEQRTRVNRSDVLTVAGNALHESGDLVSTETRQSTVGRTVPSTRRVCGDLAVTDEQQRAAHRRLVRMTPRCVCRLKEVTFSRCSGVSGETLSQ